MGTTERVKVKSKVVTFSLPAEVEAETVALCGDFNDWAPDSVLLKRDANGRWSTDVELEAGRSYLYRFLLDGERWENDWAALAYEPNEYGLDNSLITV
jgi:1,4-alpha-glucan branching enzyme